MNYRNTSQLQQVNILVGLVHALRSSLESIIMSEDVLPFPFRVRFSCAKQSNKIGGRDRFSESSRSSQNMMSYSRGLILAGLPYPAR